MIDRIRSYVESGSGMSKDIVALIVIILLVSSVFLHVYGGFTHGIELPLAPLHGDTVFYLELFLQVESGHWMSDSLLGAPFGSDWADVPVLSWGHLAIIWICQNFSSNLFLTFNITFLLFMSLAASSLYYTARQIGLGRMSAIPAAVLFPLQPFVFMRFPSHFFLLGFFWVPLLVLAAWLLASGKLVRGEPGDSWRSRLNKKELVFCMLISLLAVVAAGPYYAFYAGILLTAAALYALISRGDTLSFRLGVALILLIGLGLLLALWPNIAHWNQNGRNYDISRRAEFESELYGLKLKHLLLPVPYHRLSALQNLTLKAEYGFPLENENASAKLGSLGALALMVLLFSFLFRRRHSQKEPSLLEILGLFSLVLLLYATIGGLSSLFSAFVSPQLRGHSRTVVFFAVFSVLAAAWLTEALFYKMRGGWHRAAVFSLLCLAWTLALFDIVPRPRIPIEKHLFVESINSRAQLLRQMEGEFLPGASFLQLPFVEFPEGAASHYLEPYDHLWPRLLSNRFRWSFGLTRKSWQGEAVRQLAMMSSEDLAVFLKTFGYSGIWLDHSGYADEGRAMRSSLRAVFGPELAISSDGQYSVFSATATSVAAESEHPLEVLYTVGWNERESGDEAEWRWVSGRSAELLVLNPGPEPRRVNMVFNVMRIRPTALELKMDTVISGRLADDQPSAQIPLILLPGLNRIQFVSSHAHGIRPPENLYETRRLNFAIVSLRFLQEDG